ncbi:hypothetical protein F5X97DRAFT_345969 [Nemania serpens]|nr:hypothetical protein F5X97DRAFT_345969 [Nemania serpens]
MSRSPKQLSSIFRSDPSFTNPPAATYIMDRGFRPTRAVQKDDADPQAQRHSSSRVQSSMNWRQPAPAAVTTQPQYDAPAGEKSGNTMASNDLLPRTETGASANYRGDPTLASNRSAVIPDSKNTSLWVTGIPRECASYSDLMDLLKGSGRILAASINDAPSRFRTAAATITFFRHVDAENVMRAMNDGTLRAPLVSQAPERRCTRHAGALVISTPIDHQDDLLVAPECEEPALALIDVGHAETASRPKSPSDRQQPESVRLRASWSRVRVAELELRRGHVREHRRHRGCPQLPSRVIRVRGLPEYVRPASLEVYFNSRFRYDLDRVIYRGTTKHGLEEYEYRFACWKNQAEFAIMALNREMRGIEAWYGVDPCEVPGVTCLMDED